LTTTTASPTTSARCVAAGPRAEQWPVKSHAHIVEQHLPATKSACACQLGRPVSMLEGRTSQHFSGHHAAASRCRLRPHSSCLTGPGKPPTDPRLAAPASPASHHPHSPHPHTPSHTPTPTHTPFLITCSTLGSWVPSLWCSKMTKRRLMRSGP
jgi:hypothetical protein